MNEVSTLEVRRAPLRTTIGLKQTTRSRLDKNRVPGQCYDSFIQQIVDLWKRSKVK
jgi:hypothetical protein